MTNQKKDFVIGQEPKIEVKENIIKKESIPQNIPSKVDKSERIPLHKQDRNELAKYKLDLENFHYHWANAFGNNIENLMKAGYEHVLDEKNSPVSRSQGRNSDGLQYLMYMPKDMWEADQQDALEPAREIDRLIGKERPSFGPGSDFLRYSADLAKFNKKK